MLPRDRMRHAIKRSHAALLLREEKSMFAGCPGPRERGAVEHKARQGSKKGGGVFDDFFEGNPFCSNETNRYCPYHLSGPRQVKKPSL
jgi:hypothetical protein